MANHQCDEGCWNEYCAIYDIGGTFSAPKNNADFGECSANITGTDANCSASRSSYLDPNLPTDSIMEGADGPYGVCKPEYSGDGFCEVLCL